MPLDEPSDRQAFDDELAVESVGYVNTQRPDSAAALVRPIPLPTTSMTSLEANAPQAQTLSPRLFNINVDSVSRRLRLENNRSESRPDSRSSSVAGTNRQLGTQAERFAGSVGSGSRAPNDSILSTVRRQMEALEDKLGAQIKGVQQQNDRLRDVALSRVDSKMGAIETLQPKFDRRLSELSGNFKGLSDEMQCQIRRVDQMESRLWEWRHQLEEEVRGKFMEHEQNHQETTSAVRVNHASAEELFKRMHKRLLLVEGALQDHVAKGDESHGHIQHLHDRLMQLESTQDLREAEDCEQRERGSGAIQPGGMAAVAMHDFSDHHATLATVEARVLELCQKFDIMQDDVASCTADSKAQEERLKSIRTLSETKEEHYRWLNDRVERADWDGKFKDVTHQLSQLSSQKIDHVEKIDLAFRRLDDHDEMLHGEVSDSMRRLHQHVQGMSNGEIAVAGAAGGSLDSSDAALSLELKECMVRLADTEVRLENVVTDLASARAGLELAPRVCQLVDQLKDIAPKVISQESVIQELHERMGRMNVALSNAKIPDGGFGQDRMDEELDAAPAPDTPRGGISMLTGRLGRLEAQVSRLVAEVEGGGSANIDNGNDNVGC